jgi:hypothetical protein
VQRWWENVHYQHGSKLNVKLYRWNSGRAGGEQTCRGLMERFTKNDEVIV